MSLCVYCQWALSCQSGTEAGPGVFPPPLTAEKPLGSAAFPRAVFAFPGCPRSRHRVGSGATGVLGEQLRESSVTSCRPGGNTLSPGNKFLFV